MKAKKSDTPLIRAAVAAWNAYIKFGPVDDGRPEGEAFEESLDALMAAIHAARAGISHEPELESNDICPHCGCEEGLDYKDIDGVEDGNLEQTVTCPKCEKRWIDVFALIKRRTLCGSGI